MVNAEIINRKIIFLEGNIGVGKSTFLAILGQRFDFDIIFEPTDKWQQVSTEGNLLDLFYKDTKRWAYTFQSYAFISRIKTHLDQNKKISTRSLQIFERSVYCDRFCFAKNCFENGLMSELEWNIYKEWFSWIVPTYAPEPSGFIYLRALPDVCYQRLKKRNRTEESTVSLAYLNTLHTKHDDWLIHKKETLNFLSTPPVLTLDCNYDFEHNKVQQANILNQVDIFIQNLKTSSYLTKKQNSLHTESRLP